jgi:hypothetical protein
VDPKGSLDVLGGGDKSLAPSGIQTPYRGRYTDNSIPANNQSINQSINQPLNQSIIIIITNSYFAHIGSDS